MSKEATMTNQLPDSIEDHAACINDAASVDAILNDLNSRLSDQTLTFTTVDVAIGQAMSDIAYVLADRLREVAKLPPLATPSLSALAAWISVGIESEKENNLYGSLHIDRHLFIGSILRLGRQ